MSLASMLATVEASAQTSTQLSLPAATPRAASDCATGGGFAGEVANVVDGKSFRLADGREVRLAAIETPSGQDDVAGVAAKAALETAVLHRTVTVRPAGAAGDRYGRVTAYAFVMQAGAESFVQHALLAAGHALVSPAAMAAGCRAVLRAAERAARAAKLGLWSDPFHVVKDADKTADMLSEQGRFMLVTGKVASVRESGGVVYVNFGRRWSEDFTVTVLKRNERLFAGAGMTPKALAGRRIEVRGWIEERGGPAIEAARPEQIEIVD